MWIQTIDNTLVNADKIREIHLSYFGKDGRTAIECELDNYYEGSENWCLLGVYPTKEAAQYAFRKLGYAIGNWAKCKMGDGIVPILSPKDCEFVI